MAEWISLFFSYILGPSAGAAVGWLVGRRKMNVEADGGELDNVDKAIEIYRKMIKDLEAWKMELIQKMQVIEIENQSLRDQLKQERSENNNMRSRISTLEMEIETLKKNA